ncbi:MAG: hypothetical protein GXP32_01530 [Kiritimatiellaeota bacterium]|nr:hypothetical protein [Kiritimatiellota bacterium]
MKKTKILVNLEKTRYKVKMIGRPTFAVAGVLRKLATRLDRDKSVTRISIGMKDCEGMDSTIMGMLATLALKVRSREGESKVQNPGKNKQLLNGLGLGKLFQYVDEPEGEEGSWHELQTGSAPPAPPVQENAETILDAHKKLMETHEDNVGKFRNVVDMLEKELDK